MLLVLGFPLVLVTLAVSAQIPLQLSVWGMLMLALLVERVLRTAS